MDLQTPHLKMNELDGYLAGEYETQEDGDRQLAVTKEDDVKKIRVGWMLKEEPEKRFSLLKC